MCNFEVLFGSSVPMPTLPLESTLTLSLPPVVTAKVSAEGKNTPVVVSTPTKPGVASVP